MTSPSPTSSPLMALIKHAQRHMAYMRSTRSAYATPSKWAKAQQGRVIDDVATTPDLPRTDRTQTQLAARWAVADARRTDNPARAERLDREVERAGVSQSELESARWNSYERGWNDATHRQQDRMADPSTRAELSSVGVPVAAGMVVAAGLYANAYDWDEQTPEQLDITDEQWADPVPEPAPEVVDAQAGEPFDPEAALPDELHAASMEQQLSHVAADGGSPTADIGQAAEVSAGPDVAAAPGVDV